MIQVIKNFGKGFMKGVKLFGDNIAAIINFVLLSITYIIGVGLTSIFTRLGGKKFIQTKISKKRKSYWSKLDLKDKSLKSYFRTF